MHKEIKWSAKAIMEYQGAIQYLLDEWGKLTAGKFREHTNKQLERIANSPSQFPVVSQKKNVRRCVVNKQISIFFTEQQEVIYIIRFFNNQQNPGKLRSVL